MIMPITLDHIAKSDVKDGRTPHEQGALAGALDADIAKLEKAERVSKGLRPGEHQWSCPDLNCSMTWQGPAAGHAYKAYMGHVKRHAHARIALQMSNPIMETA